MLIIGLGTKARQGKDTVAAAMQERALRDANGQVRLMSFADPLREEISLAAQDAFEREFPDTAFVGELHGREALRLLCHEVGQPYDAEALADAAYPWGKQRVLLQWWGTEYRRAQDQDYWVKQAKAKLLRAERENVCACILRDLRFPNEFAIVGELGGWRVKISRFGYDPDVPQHASETALDNHTFDIAIGVADGNIEVLRAMGADLFTRLLNQSRA